jgi:predicted PurR-regulated permease PerM
MMNNKITNKNTYDIGIRLAFLALIVAWCLLILLPFKFIILWGVILAVAFAPAHASLSKKLNGKKKIASSIIILSGLAIIIMPSWLFLDSIFDGVKGLKTAFEAGTLTIPPPSEEVKTWPLIGDKLYALWNSASINLEQTIMKYKDHLVGFGGQLIKGTLTVVGAFFQIILAVIIAGVLLITKGTEEAGRKLFKRLAGERGDEFAEITYKTVGKVVKGILGVAFIQSFVIGIGFLLAGVPYAGLWTLLVFMLAILQIPPTLVVIPVIIYLFSTLNPTPAILWSIFLMAGAISDNILKPILLGKGAPVPMLVIFIGVIGGFMLSGFIGLFTGAIVMSLGYKLFEAWLDEGLVSETTET